VTPVSVAVLESVDVEESRGTLVSRTPESIGGGEQSGGDLVGSQTSHPATTSGPLDAPSASQLPIPQSFVGKPVAPAPPVRQFAMPTGSSRLQKVREPGPVSNTQTLPPSLMVTALPTLTHVPTTLVPVALSWSSQSEFAVQQRNESVPWWQ